MVGISGTGISIAETQDELDLGCYDEAGKVYVLANNRDKKKKQLKDELAVILKNNNVSNASKELYFAMLDWVYDYPEVPPQRLAEIYYDACVSVSQPKIKVNNKVNF